MISEAVRALLALDLFARPILGVALVCVGILLRKLRGLSPGAWQWLELGLAITFVCLGLISELAGLWVLTIMLLGLAIIYSAFAGFVRIVTKQWTTLAGTVCITLLLGSALTTILLQHTEWETAAVSNALDNQVLGALLTGVLCTIMCVVELVMGVRYRLMIRGGIRKLSRLKPPSYVL